MSDVDNISNSYGSGEISINASILERAIKGESDALSIMFKQFIFEDEEIYFTQYLGIKGLWGIGTHSFACLTNRRVADISVGAFGEVVYQDGYLEFVNSAVIYQPSKLGLYLQITAWIIIGFLTSITLLVLMNTFLGFAASFLLALLTIIVTFLLIPFVVKFYYRYTKCGIVFWIREGVPIYIFCNRKLLKRANIICREITIVRENRLKAIKKSA